MLDCLYLLIFYKKIGLIYYGFMLCYYVRYRYSGSRTDTGWGVSDGVNHPEFFLFSLYERVRMPRRPTVFNTLRFEGTICDKVLINSKYPARLFPCQSVIHHLKVCSCQQMYEYINSDMLTFRESVSRMLIWKLHYTCELLSHTGRGSTDGFNDQDYC